MADTTPEAVPNEFRLAAACAMWPPSERRNVAIAQAVSVAIDWEKLARVAHRHRIVGLVHDGLRRAEIAVPEAVEALIAEAAAAQLRQNLQFAAEIVRLKRAFDARELPVTFFKGVPTAIDVYGNIGIRHSKDLDILVARTDMEDAETILDDSGYVRVGPPANLDPARVATLISMGKDFIYRRRDNAELEVELHWRLFNNAHFLSALVDKAEVRAYRELDNVQIRTFVGDDQFAYLCGHGAAFAWCRLKWLADIGALLAREPPQGILRMYEAAARRGAARPAAQAILLCHRLLQTEVPEDVLAKLRSDPAVQRLERLAVTAMTRGGAETEPLDLSSGMRPIAWSLWFLDGSPRYLWGELNSRWISWDDVVNVPLPSGLQFLYPVIRMPLWLWRKANSRLRTKSA